MRQLFVLICTLLCLSGFSQKADQRNALWTIRGNVGIPKAISSKMYRTSFAGLYEANLSVNLRLFDNMYMGIGYQNSHFQNNKFLKQQIFNASIPYNTRLMGHGFFFKLGYDQFFSEKGYVSYSLNSGYMLCSYLNVNADTTADNRPYQALKFGAPYFQPELSVNLRVEGNMAFSFLLSYTTLVHRFDARAPRFNQFNEIRSASNKYLISWINFGVGFTILINQKK
jgi:hypothetical protein